MRFSSLAGAWDETKGARDPITYPGARGPQTRFSIFNSHSNYKDSEEK